MNQSTCKVLHPFYNILLLPSKRCEWKKFILQTDVGTRIVTCGAYQALAAIVILVRIFICDS